MNREYKETRSEKIARLDDEIARQQKARFMLWGFKREVETGRYTGDCRMFTEPLIQDAQVSGIQLQFVRRALAKELEQMLKMTDDNLAALHLEMHNVMTEIGIK